VGLKGQRGRTDAGERTRTNSAGAMPPKKEEDEQLVKRNQGTLAPGNKPRALESLESIGSCVSQTEFAQPSQCLIVFDWDDTLCPSHWIRANRPALQFFSPAPKDPKFQKPLGEVQDIVCNILHTAAELGKIVIVTNAQVNWVQTSCQNFLPKVGPVIQQHNCGIVYARAKFELDPPSPQGRGSNRFEYNSNANCPQTWKEDAFRGEITKFYQRYANQSWKNIVSVGDQVCEHDACKIVVSQRPAETRKRKCRVKTIKLLEDPSIEDLVAQLHVVHSWLRGIVAYDGNLDVDLGEDDDTIFELHQRLIQE
jgi:hypothetical protein